MQLSRGLRPAGRWENMQGLRRVCWRRARLLPRLCEYSRQLQVCLPRGCEAPARRIDMRGCFVPGRTSTGWERPVPRYWRVPARRPRVFTLLPQRKRILSLLLSSRLDLNWRQCYVYHRWSLCERILLSFLRSWRFRVQVPVSSGV